MGSSTETTAKKVREKFGFVDNSGSNILGSGLAQSTIPKYSFEPGSAGLVDTSPLAPKTDIFSTGAYVPPDTSSSVSEDLTAPPTVPGLHSALANDAANSKPWYQDGQAMQGYAGLASSLTNLALLAPQLSAYKQNLKESKHNLARAKIAAERKDTMYENLNTPMTASTQGVTRNA